MDRTTTGRASAIALLGAILVAGSAAAASRAEVTVTRGIVLDTTAAASATCGFPIELHTVGKEVSIQQVDVNGNLRAETIVQHYDGYLLNPANGKRLASRVSGPTRWVYHGGGAVTESTSGSTTRTAPGSGLVSGFIGHAEVTLVPTLETDPDGNPVFEIAEDTFHGQFLGNAGICAVLA